MNKKTRKDFPIFKNHKTLAYLDNASTTQTPKVVIDQVSEHYKKNRANIHRGIYQLSEETSSEYENVRKKVADFIGAEKNEIIFTSGATHSSNMAIRSIEESFGIKAGDEIVLSHMEHHSTVIPLQELAKRKKCKLKYVHPTDTSSISKKTKIVAAVLASNVTGEINNLSKIISKAREVGALSIVDGAQAVGHIEVNVKKLGADLFFFSGHKMCGPTGVGVLYGKRELLDGLKPSVFGGGAVSEVGDMGAVFLEVPQKFEAGTPPIAQVVGLGAAIDYLQNIGIEAIHAHIKDLHKYTIEKLSSIDRIKLFTSEENNSGIISFNIDGIHPHDIAEILSRNNVAVRAGHHCAMPFMKELGIKGSVRISLYIYNTKKDIDKCIEAIKDVKKIFNI